MSIQSQLELNALQQDIDEWINLILPADYPAKFPPPTAEKVIREAVLGHQVLKPHEYVILDCPVIQRLRYIHQTALTYMVYPTANHTRFDHSLGVAKIAERIGLALGLEPNLIEELRIAALLHDVGHCLFSHLSEGLIKQKFKTKFTSIKETPLFQDSSAGEIISYLIITSPRFKKLMENVFEKYNKKLNVDRISRLIIGKPKNPAKYAYMGDIIHGPFDVDKLVYLIRDCYFTGIRADVDVDRVVLACSILDRKKYTEFPRANLIIKKAGVSNLEQIVLHKILLYSAIYHHHKVRVLECMIRGIFETIWDNPDEIKYPQLKFEKVSDFLKINEFEFLALGKSEQIISKQIEAVLNRNLLKRCLIISPNYIIDGKTVEGHDIYNIGEEYPDRIRQLRQFVWEEIPPKFRTSLHQLWVDLPDPPNIDKDADRCWIDVGTSHLKRLRDFLPYGEWLDAYEANKWQGHVFYTCDDGCREAGNRAAKKVFKELFHLEFDQAATDGCKF
jgi:HD superfamily phosphohydrolase